MGFDPNLIPDNMFAKTPGDGHEPNFWSMKLVSYPPVKSKSSEPALDAEYSYGVGAHTTQIS
jgi:hypothetical protein